MDICPTVSDYTTACILLQGHDGPHEDDFRILHARIRDLEDAIRTYTAWADAELHVEGPLVDDSYVETTWCAECDRYWPCEVASLAGVLTPRRRTSRIESACPTCGTDMDAWTALEEGAEPGPDAVFVCFYCADILALADGDYVVHPDREAIAADPDIVRLRAEITAFDRGQSRD